MSEKTLSKYGRIFGEDCIKWSADRRHNYFFIKAVQSYFNDLLKSRGYVFIDEIYKQLSIENTKDCYGIGWIYEDDNYIAIDICADIGPQHRLALDFNVDGYIIDRIKELNL